MKPSVKQANRWRPGLWQVGERLRGSLAFEMFEDLFDHHRIFDTGDHLYRTATGRAGLDIDIEYTLQTLGPGHGSTTLGRSSLLFSVFILLLFSLAPLGWRHQGPMSAVRGKHAMKTCQVDPGLGYQRGQLGQRCFCQSAS